MQQARSRCRLALLVYAGSMPREVRPKPRDLTSSWPDTQADTGVGEVARRFALNLVAAIGNQSVRAAARDIGLNHVTLLGILDGRTWPDLETIAKIERGLKADLWPGRVDGRGVD